MPKTFGGLQKAGIYFDEKVGKVEKVIKTKMTLKMASKCPTACPPANIFVSSPNAYVVKVEKAMRRESAQKKSLKWTRFAFYSCGHRWSYLVVWICQDFENARTWQKPLFSSIITQTKRSEEGRKILFIHLAAHRVVNYSCIDPQPWKKLTSLVSGGEFSS
ncbi:unnamed protein product [Allacma fusca]|uniref:Uncharacterized protein n=1 Tax=Allacma fusca TaxID=39272 RepID=A0A8J2JRZ7_9HEXA|nr:unnamed protein product [Allacma fusca]